ncbi:MAG TPA: Na+/H+ antiporter [Solibacterales bacterium]|nr:Na+/H+ antiporter [Bryobacterales bacterium]
MHSIELFLGLLLAALAIAVAAKRFELPYPIALVLGGCAIALAPGIPLIRLDPQLVFVLLLPPILGEAAYFTSWRDFVQWKRAILLLAFGLVAATSAVVAAVCVWLIPAMTWSVGFVLGAIVSPPDAAAATAIMRGLGLPRRITQILEGESLVNDASGLTVYRFAIAAALTGAFSPSTALLTFLWISLGGVAIGVAVGWLFVRLYPRIRDPEVEILSTFMLCYAAYVLAEAVHASGVLSTVAAGLILGWASPRLFTAMTRIRATAVWQSAIFLINCSIFLLIGLQLPAVLRTLQSYPAATLLQWAALLSAAVIGIRFLWVYVMTYLPRALFAAIRKREPKPTPRAVAVVAWTGLRGVVSLAAALALPDPFPHRDLLLFLTFTVIVATLGLQGLTLRPFIRALRLPKDLSSEEEQLKARLASTENALTRLRELEAAQAAPPVVLARVRGYFEDRLAGERAEFEAHTRETQTDKPEEFKTIAEQRIWWELAKVERETLIDLRKRRVIGDEALRRLEQDIDLLEARIVPR